MSSKDTLLSICIPTYNNGECLKQVLHNALAISADDIEFIVSDDGSTDSTTNIIGEFDDERLEYYRNESNLGYEKNLLETIDRAQGEYVMPLSDEDRTIAKNINWALDLIRDPSVEFSNIIGGFGWEGTWCNESWEEAVPETMVLSPGRESLLSFVTDLPHPFAEHTWKRNYIGGFLLKKGTLNLKEAEDYFGSYYIHNVLIIQAMMEGSTIITPRELSHYHYYEHEGDHRIWGSTEWNNLHFRVELQEYRVKLIADKISDSKVRRVYIEKEKHFAAHLAAWAIYSHNIKLAEIQNEALSSDIRLFNEIWSCANFYVLVMYYLLLLPLPIPPLKKGLSRGFLAKRAPRVWYELAKRVLPHTLHTNLKDYYKNKVRPKLSSNI